MSGFVTVGIRPTLPVDGVSLLLGNDIAGERVTTNPWLSSLPCSDSTDQLMQDIPACAVTHSRLESNHLVCQMTRQLISCVRIVVHQDHPCLGVMINMMVI